MADTPSPKDDLPARGTTTSLDSASAPAVQEHVQLVIPAPRRTITVADLAGEWEYHDGITETQVDRDSGTYVGSVSLHFAERWTIAGDGHIFLDFFAIQNGKKISEKSSGAVTLAGGILVIEQGKTGGRRRYVLRGWLAHPEVTIMQLNGPWYDDPIPANIFSDPDQGANLDKRWVRIEVLSDPCIA